MENLINNYVRDKSGLIYKFVRIGENEECVYIGTGKFVIEFDDKEDMQEYIEKKIVKHSENLIDLIEADDYVNGYKVVSTSDDYVVILTDDEEQGELLQEKDIKTILTKEEYERNCYKVEE